MSDRALVIGAGLAGLAAAEQLVDAGMRVTVIDAFPRPGGRTANFDVSTPVAGLVPGDVVEHGLHAWFQHYHALFALMDRAGIAKPPLAGDGVYLWNPECGHLTIEGGPVRWLVNALRLPELVRGSRVTALGAFWRLIRDLDRALSVPVETDRESAGALLRRYGVPEEAVQHVFRPCVFSLTSLPIDELSALEFLRWMSNILPDPRIRCLQGGGTTAMCDPIAEYLRSRGVDFRLGVEVTQFSLDAQGRMNVTLAQAPDRTGLRHILVNGFVPADPPDPRSFDAMVCTLPWERLHELSRRDQRLMKRDAWANMKSLRNIHPLTMRLWFEDAIVGAEEHYILSSGTIFDVLRPTPEPGRYDGMRLIDALVENVETHLPALLYRTERYLDPTEAKDIAQSALSDLERLYPGQIRRNRLLRSFFHTREGIVACLPGAWQKRAPQDVGISGFVLAGDWTRQPYGVCMEGAVRSGQMAAHALLSGEQREEKPPPFAQLAYSLRTIFARS